MVICYVLLWPISENQNILVFVNHNLGITKDQSTEIFACNAEF